MQGLLYQVVVRAHRSLTVAALRPLGSAVAPVLEVQPQHHGDEARAVLRAGGAAEGGRTDGSVHGEIRPVERVEGVGAELQANFVAVTGWPNTHLLHQRDIVYQNRRLPEVAVVLGRCSERELRRNRERRGVV